MVFFVFVFAMISEGSYERPWRRGGKVWLVHHGGSRERGKYPTTCTRPELCLLKGGKRGVEGETSAADRETRKMAKVDFQMIKHNMRLSKTNTIQVDYNEEKSGVKKKGEEGSEDEIQEVRFCLPGQLFHLMQGEGGGWQG